MYKRLIVFDIGLIQFRAIFSYLSQYKKGVEKIVSTQNTDVYSAKNILNQQIRSREIYLANPDYNFCNMISGYCNVLKINLDDLIVCAQDFGSWRKEISKEYKAQRSDYLTKTIMESLFVTEEESKEWLQNQYDLFNDLYKKLDESLPFHWIKIYKDEADDIASCCIRFIDAEEKILVTSDHDWYQLCSINNTKIFSPYKRKFIEVKNPESILIAKINNTDISDNLLEKPKTEAEYELRKKIVNLLELPIYIETPVKERLANLSIKNVYVNKIPFNSIKNKFKKIYNLT